MYGYVLPIKEQLTQADFCLYRSFYCGICMATGQVYGQLPRFTTNYDATFLGVLLYDYAGRTAEFAAKRCICNPRRKSIVCRDELMDKLVAVNLLLAYCKAEDDVLDGGGLRKKLVRRMLRKPYRAAAAMLPRADELVRSKYEALRALERQGETSIDRVSDCFASMLEGIGVCLIDDVDEHMRKLLYNIGKYVYLADALDDVTEDSKKKRYNPFLAAYGNFRNRKQFIEDNREALTFVLAGTVNRAIGHFNARVWTGADSLLRNVMHAGLRRTCEQLLQSEKKLPPPKL